MTPLQSIHKIIDAEIDPAFAKRARFILNGIHSNKPQRVLDIGCGRGYYTKLTSLFPFVKEIQSIDANPEYVKRAKKNVGKDKRITIQTGSIYKLPFKNNYFDCIIASEILEHLERDEKAVVELHRVLKKDGTLLVSVPNKNYPFLWDPLNWILEKAFNTHIHKDRWWLAGIWADHERLYSVKEIRNLLGKKFAVSKLETAVSWSWPMSHFVLYGIGKNIVERIGANSVDRFNFHSSKPFSTVLAKFLALPSNFLDKRAPTDVSVDIVIAVEKK